MKTILGRKQTLDNERWLYAMEHIEELITRDELSELVATTCESIINVTQGKNVAYSWSGGKDSIVLSALCRSVGITNCMFAHTELEYPEFLKWCIEHKPDNCTVINTGQDIKWLASNQAMIFPHGRELNKWYAIVQRAAFTRYFFDNDLDMILVGHRKADGNMVGKDGVIRKGSGEVRYSPLADWPHEMILAYIHYNRLEIPPIYKWENGFKCGTHPWPSRMYIKTVEQGYQEVYKIDPTIIELAAEHIPSARHFLEGVSSI